MELKKTIAALSVRIGADTTGFSTGLKKAGKDTGYFKKQVKEIGTVMLAAFSARAIGGFLKSSFEMAARAEGIRAAFKRLNDPTLLDKLKEATRGTVSEMKLMQTAITAHNFKIPLTELASLFRFATNRAAETGQEIDYMVESIITGIARKSLPILDNLGLSMTEIREEFAKTGDFAEAVGNIIRREMQSMGDITTTTSQEIAKWGATWENMKEKAGKFFIENIIDVEGLDHFFTVQLSDYLTRWEKFKMVVWTRKFQMEELYNKISSIKPVAGLPGMAAIAFPMGPEKAWKSAGTKEQIPIYEQLNTELEEYVELKKQATSREMIAFYNDEIQALEREIKALDKLSQIRKVEHIEKIDPKTTIPFFDTDVVNVALANMDHIIDRNKQLQNQLVTTSEFVKAANALLKQAFIDLAKGVADGLAGLFTGTGSLEDFGKGILSVVGSFLTQMGELIIAYGVAMEAFQKAFENPYAAIAAGFALMLLGSAASNLAAQGPNYSSGNSGSGNYGTASVNIGNLSQVELFAHIRANELYVTNQRDKNNTQRFW